MNLGDLRPDALRRRVPENLLNHLKNKNTLNNASRSLQMKPFKGTTQLIQKRSPEEDVDLISRENRNLAPRITVYEDK